MIKNRAIGFTIVELLIVIVIIGVLATITIVAYNGISNRAIVANLQTDVESAVKSLEVYKFGTSASDIYPVANDCSSTPADDTTCIKSGDDTSITYNVNNSIVPPVFCISATNGSVSYRATNSVTTPTQGSCPAVSDNFEGPLNTSNWVNSWGTPTPNVVSGRMRLVTNSVYVGIQTGLVLDLNNYPVSIEIPTIPNPGAGSTQTMYNIGNGSSEAGMRISGNPSQLMMSMTGQSNTTVTYNATNHRWLRYRVESGNFLWEASANNVTWTTLRTIAAPSWSTNSLLRISLMSGHWSAETSPGYVEFDNFNL